MVRRPLNIVVVGGGLMGLCTARSLLRRGHRVILLERDKIPNPVGSSVDYHRLIRYTYGTNREYTQMVRQAYAAWDDLWSDVGTAWYRNTGTLIVGAMDDPWVRQTQTVLDEEEIEFELIENDVADRFPVLDPSLESGLFVPDGGVLLASEIILSLYDLITDQGAEIRMGSKVVSISESRCEVHLEDGSSVRGDRIVVAAGAWISRLLGDFSTRVTPSRQVCVLLDPHRSTSSHWMSSPMLINLDSRDGFYAVPPVAGTPLKIGDHRFSMIGDPDGARTVSKSEIDALTACLDGRFAHPDRYVVSGSIVCFYTVAPQERFIVEERNGLWILSGFSGHGFKFGPLIGERVADAIDGMRQAEDVSRWAAGG